MMRLPLYAVIVYMGVRLALATAPDEIYLYAFYMFPPSVGLLWWRALVNKK